LDLAMTTSTTAQPTRSHLARPDRAEHAPSAEPEARNRGRIGRCGEISQRGDRPEARVRRREDSRDGF
jgi:hypothetical protein